MIVIFIFQGIWLFIDDLAGKGLGIVIIAKFIFYFIPTLIDKVLPLTVLLSSILTFGTFAENYEFAAMKASGISLQRGMRSLIVFVLFLGVVTFFFANNVIPKSEQKMFNLRRNIAKVKPAAAITEGVFSDFEGTGQGMNIKVDRKHGEQDRFLENVIIHKKNNQNINTTVIKAKSGELISSEESDIIQLVLKDGNYYEELTPKDAKERRKQPFAKSDFETYTINIDISELNDQDLEEDQNITTNKMKNVSRLIKDIDSLRENNLEKVEAFSKNIVNRMGAFPAIAKKDSIDGKPAPELIVTDKDKKVKKDSIRTIDDLVNNLQQWEQLQVMKKAKNDVSGILSTVIAKKDELQTRYKFYNSHILSLHQKYALALSCIILFFVGAPLGAIIRKGGLGLPMVIAIVLFLTYYFIGVFAGNYAKEGNIHPALGAWLSTLIMMPLGISLTKRATADKGLFGFGNIIDFFKSLFKKKNQEKGSFHTLPIQNSANSEVYITNYTSKEELSILIKSLHLIMVFPKSLNIASSAEFIKIHERNINQLNEISSTDNSGIIKQQINLYPTISKEEINYFIDAKKKNQSFTSAFVGKLTALIIQLIKTKGNTITEIELKLEEISRINNNLIQIIRNSN